MNQVMHVFKKDARHHWIEIVLCQAALVAYVWHEIQEWTSRELYLGSNRFLSLPTVIYFALPITWWFFISRVVQSESLVGDRQFWITRPYEWKKLLAAKALMILCFINLPLFCAQIFLLLKAGFAPWQYLPGVLFMQLMLILLPFVPILAMATVTRNIAQGLLGVLAIILFIAGMLVLGTYMPEAVAADGEISDWIQGALVVIASVMAIGVQFRWRKTGRARMFLASAPVVLLVLFIATPYLLHGENDFPVLSGSSAPLRAALSYKPSAPRVPPDKDEDVTIAVPILTLGPEAGYMAKINAARLRLENEEGVRWDSKWQSVHIFFLPGENRWMQDFKLSQQEFEKMKSLQFKATVSLKSEIFQDHDARQIKLGQGEFEMPGVGRCHLEAKSLTSILCHSPLVKPESVFIKVQSADSTCPPLQDDEEDSAPATPVNILAYAWELNGDERPAEYGLNPVETFTLYMRERDTYASSVRICPGTPLTLSFPMFSQSARTEFEINQFNLEEYRQEPFRFRFGGITVRKKQSR
jgi:hypothetical protein